MNKSTMTADLATVLFGLGSVAVAAVIVQVIRFARADCDLALYSKSLPPDAYKGKVVWITGASSGIGESLAHVFSRQGAKLILSSRRADELERVRKSLPGPQGAGHVVVLPLDLTDLGSLQLKAKEAKKAFGHIDVLVNNAGLSMRDLAVHTDPSVDEKLMTVNFFAPVRLAKCVLPDMIDGHGGQIINISSVAGKSGTFFRAPYSASKFALTGYMQALRLELIHDGVSVTIAFPGPVATNVATNALTGAGVLYGKKDELIDTGMTPERCAELVVTAAAHKLDEAWISPHPILLLFYLDQYLPSVRNMIMKSRARKVVADFKETGTIGI